MRRKKMRARAQSPAVRLRWRRQLRLHRWSKLNLSKGGVSLTLGRRGLKANVSRRGVYVTVGLPGSGFSYRWGLTWSWLAQRLNRKSARPSRSDLNGKDVDASI